MTKRLSKFLLAAILAAGMLVYAPESTFASVKDTDIVADSTAAEYIRQGVALPDVTAQYAALGTKDGRLLWGRGLDTKVQMASVTKIMTAVVALEQADLSTKMTVTEGAATIGGSTAELKKGDVLTLEQLLYCMLLPSGNDAAICIAQNISGLEGTYTKLMNAKAKELGMKSTSFADASGLEEKGQSTTAGDLLILARYAMRDTTFRTIVATRDYKIKCGKRTLKLESTDMLFQYLKDGYAIGIKTGSNVKARFCFVGAAFKSDVELYSVVLGSKRDDQRFVDTAALLEWGFANLRTTELLTPLQKVGSVGLSSWMDKAVDAYVAAPVYVNTFDLDGAINQDVELADHVGSVSAGEVLGRVVWSQGSEVLATADVVAANPVPEPDVLAGIAIGFQRFLGWFSATPDHLPTTVYLPQVATVGGQA